ncbi:MAG: toll/interleukin-1 receptor domain-containing protein [Rhodospirillales bacterium]|nr:MAG: toll/interleukin-1 receptor domain-containing protein [Rhodospirillales bacterium]
MVSVFFSYSHKDEALRDALETQLSMLKRQGIIETWHDRRIGAGEVLDEVIDRRINSDEIILLLVSPDFIASNYCYDVEMGQALKRHEARDAIVIPVILRPCEWHHAPFGKLAATPRDGKPITRWTDRDEAFLDVAQAIREAVKRLRKSPHPPSRPLDPTSTDPHTGRGRADAPSVARSSLSPAGPRSSNLRLAKTFSDRERDEFRLETFEYMARFFENSLAELGTRNAGVEGRFRRVDANRFFATIYRDGQAKVRATLFTSHGAFGNGVCYTESETMESNTMHGNVSVDADEQSMFLRGVMLRGGSSAQKLTQEGASEAFWEMMISRLQ